METFQNPTSKISHSLDCITKDISNVPFIYLRTVISLFMIVIMNFIVIGLYFLKRWIYN